jgi:hypothetical protein
MAGESHDSQSSTMLLAKMSRFRIIGCGLSCSILALDASTLALILSLYNMSSKCSYYCIVDILHTEMPSQFGIIETSSLTAVGW